MDDRNGQDDQGAEGPGLILPVVHEGVKMCLNPQGLIQREKHVMCL